MGRPLLVGGGALNVVDDDHGVQVGKHSRPPRRGCVARGLQFPVSFCILRLTRIVFGLQVSGRPPREAAGALVGGNFPNYVCQSTPKPWYRAARIVTRTGPGGRLGWWDS